MFLQEHKKKRKEESTDNTTLHNPALSLDARETSRDSAALHDTPQRQYRRLSTADFTAAMCSKLLQALDKQNNVSTVFMIWTSPHREHND